MTGPLKNHSPPQSWEARRATLVAIASNTLLFTVKGAIGVLSGSIALISDALNSLVDVVASIGVSYSVAVARRAPDEDHPFGHQRAEPLAALGVAIFTAILGFSVARAALERLISGPTPIRAPAWAIGALLFSLACSLLLSRYLRRRANALDSPAILASAVESRNDVWTSLAALTGVVGASLGAEAIDPLAGFFVGGAIIVGGYRFGRRNIDYLMGKSPRAELLARIREAALGVEGVNGVHDVRGHYVGHRIHVEAHIEVDEELRTRQSHAVAGAVRHAVEALPGIDRAFVHVDPILDSTLIVETLAQSERLASAIYAELARQHPERPAFAALWEALATRAQARAERLGIVRRLKGAGWHFADVELSLNRVSRRRNRFEDLAARVQQGLGLEEALAVAIDLESGEAHADYATAASPQDASLVASLEASTPPPPPVALLFRRIAAAREATAETRLQERLEALSRAIGSESPWN